MVSVPPPEPIPAATLVLLRHAEEGAPELLMIERAAQMAFAGGALVFPGGRIDPGDHVVAADAEIVGGGVALQDGAARVAAIRETIEEVGIAVGLEPVPAADLMAELRTGLREGAEFGRLLREQGLTLDLAVLTPFARWRRNSKTRRNFDAFFYLAQCPPDAVAEADGGESVHAFWSSAADILAGAAEGRHHIIFPTKRNLERLATLRSIDHALEHAAGHPVEPITPWRETRDGIQWLCIPDHLGYPVTAERIDQAVRG